MTALDDQMRDLLRLSRRDVEKARRELDKYVQTLGLGSVEVLTIRAVIGGLLADYSLAETELGLLMTKIISVIARENLLKKLEEMGSDD